MPANDLAGPMSRLVDEIKRLPGLGTKTAQKLAFHLLGVDREQAERLAKAILEMRARIQLCERCNNIAEGPLCPICGDPKRDQGLVLVLEQPNNIIVVERTRTYGGVYHILHGALSPLRNIGPADLKIRSLLERMRTHPIREVILATSPTTEGQAYVGLLEQAAQAHRCQGQPHRSRDSDRQRTRIRGRGDDDRVH